MGTTFPLLCHHWYESYLFCFDSSKVFFLKTEQVTLLYTCPQRPYRQNQVNRFSPTSSSDIAPSLDESIESGPFSDLQSEDDEGRKSADKSLQLTAPPVDEHRCASLVQQLLEDIQNQDKDPNIWRKIEVYLSSILYTSMFWL